MGTGMMTEDGRSAADAASGHSSKTEPSFTVSAQSVSVPNAGKPRFRLTGEMLDAVRVDMRAFGCAIVRFDADGKQHLIDPMDVRMEP